MKSVDDCAKMSWERYQELVDSLTETLTNYINENKLQFDMIVPIMRGGGVLSVSLSHTLQILRVYPVQYKYIFEEGKYEPQRWLFSLDSIKDKDKAYTVLVTEGNHVSGYTAQLCVNDIHKILPNARLYYVSIGRDYDHRQPLMGTVHEWWGMLTNETESLDSEECEKLNIVNKLVIYPWENADEELMEVELHEIAEQGGE